MLVHNIKVYISHKFSFFSSKSIDHLLSIEAAFCPPICINLGLDFSHDSEQVSLTEVVSLSVSCINESRSASYPGFTYITDGSSPPMSGRWTSRLALDGRTQTLKVVSIFLQYREKQLLHFLVKDVMILPSTEKPKPACWLKIEGKLLDAIYIVLVSLFSFFFFFCWCRLKLHHTTTWGVSVILIYFLAAKWS